MILHKEEVKGWQCYPILSTEASLSVHTLEEIKMTFVTC